MSQKFKFFFSNQLEILFKRIKAQLFESPTHPFLRRLIVVYGPAMKTWLTVELAKDPQLKVATGIEIVNLHEAFDLLTEISLAPSTQFIPSTLELSFAIEQELLNTLLNYHRLQASDQKIWHSIINYLKLEFSNSDPSIKLTRKTAKRIVSLSQHLAKCFQDYGRYSGRLVDQWESKSYEKQETWQEVLWNQLFVAKKEWTYPYRIFKNPIFHVENLNNLSLHFFSISFINKCEFQFLERLAQHIPIFYYLLSPCAMFWSDIRSDKETAHLQKLWYKKLGSESAQVQQLEELLRDRNPLLANFGRLGREVVNQIEESNTQISSLYAVSSNEIDREGIPSEDVESILSLPSLLHAVQSDMLLMRNPDHISIRYFNKSDTSIQLHVAPNKRREIEILYHNLLGMAESDPTLCPNEIIVMAPQITDYTPYIQSIFGSHESQLDFQILDLSLNDGNEFVQGFLQLIDLSDSRWDADNLLQLFSQPAFQRKHQYLASDFHLIEKWIEETGILWGENRNHRNEHLQRNYCLHDTVEETNTGTWEYGISRLLMGLTSLYATNEVLPYANIEYSESDLLGKWIQLLHSLRDDLAPLHDHSRLTLSEWSDYLICLLETYFKSDYDDAKSNDELHELKSQLEILKPATKFLKKERFSFQSIKLNLLHLLQKKTITYRGSHLQTVRFCSMVPLRAIPAKIIALLGMQEDAFPRNTSHSSLNMAVNNELSDYCPTPTDYDRYLFLEALQSAKQSLIISYLGYNHQDGKELNPSIVVEELFSYLNKHFTVDGRCILDHCVYRHPFDAFNAAYFQKNSRFRNFSKDNYKLAQTYYGQDKETPHAFVKQFQYISKPQAELIPHQTIVDIKQLMDVAKDPVKFYLNSILEIYLQKEEDREIKSQDDWMVSPLNRHIIKHAALKKPIEEIIMNFAKEGKLSSGLFKSIASQKMKDESEDISDNLEKHGIKRGDIFSIEFSKSCKSPVQLDEGHWLFPAIQLKYDSDYHVHIVGHLPYVTEKGIISLGRSSLADVWKIWPQFLVYQKAIEMAPMKLEKQLILSTLKNPKVAFIEDVDAYLKQFVSYYSDCHINISPLMPDWIVPILDRNVIALQKMLEQLYEESFFGNDYQNRELRWILRKEVLPRAEEIIEIWGAQAALLAAELRKNWYAKEGNQAI